MTHPQFGADYYPEQWPEDQWAHDAQLMKDAGLSVVRVMEFAWALIEPRPGQYDFSLFDRGVDLFVKRGFSVFLGTPTATVPAWLYDQDPSIFQIHPRYGQRDFGNRRQACLNAPAYREAARKITLECAKHFAHTPGIIGWQIDNELGHEGSDLCVCDHCRTGWHRWLTTRYVTIDALNEAWGTVFWSTTYTSFQQVPQPRPQVMSIQNPSLILDYYRFLSDTATEFVAEHGAMLRSWNTDWEITTDTFIPPNGHIIDLAKLFEPLDSVGVNNYPVWGDQEAPIPPEMHTYAIQLFRGLKDRPHFTVFEQICGFQGHRVLGYLPPPAQIVHWTNHVVAHGAERVLYFRWRTARRGQEQLCYGLVNPGQDDTPHFAALRRAWKENAPIYRRILESHRQPQALVLWNKDEARLLKDQWISKGMLYDAGFVDVGYDVEVATFAAPLTVFNVDMDLRESETLTRWPLDLSTYKIIFLPMKQLEDSALVGVLEAWVRAGGTLVLGYRSGTRTSDNAAIVGDLPGVWGPMAGVTVRSFEGLGTVSTPLTLTCGSLGRVLNWVGKVIRPAKPAGTVWADYLEPGWSADESGATGTGGPVAGWGPPATDHAGPADGSAATGTPAAPGPAAGSAHVAVTTAPAHPHILARWGGVGWNRGKAAVTMNDYGQGRVVYVGTRLNPPAMVAIFRRIFKTDKIKTDFVGPGIEILHKFDPDQRPFRVILNHTGKTRNTPYGRIPAYGIKEHP